MATTEDDMGTAVRQGAMTVDEAVTVAQGQDFVVYPAMNLTEGSETWEQVEELGGGSTLFADLRKAGATPEQMDEIGAQIERARLEGRTMDVMFGWGPGEAENTAQGTTGGDSTVAETGTPTA
jgi:hypothetical protein